MHRIRLRQSVLVPTAPEDDEALRWEGDDEPAPARPATTTAEEAPPADGPEGPRGLGIGDLVALGVLGGVFLLETLGWVRSVTGVVLASTVSPGTGTPLELAAYGVNLLGRVAAVAAPPLWFALVVWRVRASVARIGWLVLGALLLLPWPALIGLA